MAMHSFQTRPGSGAATARDSAVAGSAEAEIASEWVTVQASKVRLVAGWRGTEVIAGVELQLGDGWKTYWRSPGDAGGVPPFFDWSGSENVKDTAVLYPAPETAEPTRRGTAWLQGRSRISGPRRPRRSIAPGNASSENGIRHLP